MKTIKKCIFLFLLFPVLGGLSFDMQAQPLKFKARQVLKRTARVIIVAHRTVKKNKVYTGDLSKAIAHQKLARIRYSRGKYARAIHHSRRARVLAVQAIKANKGTPPPDAGFTAEEDSFAKDAPNDDLLDQELKKELPNEKMKDEDIIQNEPDVDVK